MKYALWDGFYSLPKTLGEVAEDDPPKYVKMSHDEHLHVDLYSHPKDPRFSIMFDKHGSIAGLRTAVSVHKLQVQRPKLNLRLLGFWKPIEILF